MRLALRDGERVVRGQAVIALEALGHRAGQFGHGRTHLLDPLGRDDERRQIGVGEIAVVVRVFLAAHRTGLATPAVGVRVEQHRGLLHRATVFDQVDLPLDFAVDRLLQELEAVEVLDLATDTVRRARLAHRDVRVAAETAFLHVAVADAQPHHQRVQGARVLGGLCARAHVGFGDDLEQRRAGTVEVDAGLTGVILVQRLAGVFFEVCAGEVHPVRDIAHHEIDSAALDHRRFVLADLVALGQVGIEIVLAREDRVVRDLRAHRQSEADRALDRTSVHHRQRARQRQIDRRGLGVGCRAELRRRAAEDLAVRRQLSVGLEADDDLVAADELWGCGHGHKPSWAGARRCQSVACWKACAACSRVAS